MHGASRRQPGDGPGGRIGKSSGDANDLFGRDTAFFGRPDRSVIFQFQVSPLNQAGGMFLLECPFENRCPLLEQVDTVHKISDEGLGPEALYQDHVGQYDGEGTVFAGNDRQPLVRLGRR